MLIFCSQMTIYIYIYVCIYYIFYNVQLVYNELTLCILKKYY